LALLDGLVFDCGAFAWADWLEKGLARGFTLGGRRLAMMGMDWPAVVFVFVLRSMKLTRWVYEQVRIQEWFHFQILCEQK
jgi:hypothetical protein